jgi:very-short-patch-repair endonuclease
MRKLSQKEFINKCLEVHGDRYDYSLVEYKNIRGRIKILCKKHGLFEQISKNHKDGQGCPRCSMPNYNLTKNEFIIKCDNKNYDYSLITTDIVKSDDRILIININNGLTYKQLSDHHRNGITPTLIESKSLIKKLKDIHNNKYDYIIDTETVYATTKIKIINNETKDEFLYRVDRHLKGMSPNKVTLNLFLFKSSKIHGDKYDYSLIKSIKGNNDKVDILCEEHGVFKQRVSNHMNLGDGCPKCVGVGKWNTELLISEFKKVHGNKFDYSSVIFTNIDIKVDIICKEHGNFKQNIHKHLNGQGCRLCESNSKGEEYVKMWLDEMNINYFRQHSFETCRYINPLFFDFYLPMYNTCIEFDGEQHYKPVSKFGGVIEFNNTKLRDNVKNKWCLDNNVNLIRIKYNEVNKIKYILEEKLQLVDKK